MSIINQNQLSENNLTVISLLMGGVVGSVAALIAIFFLVMLGPLLPLSTSLESLAQTLPLTWYGALQTQATLMGFPIAAESKSFWYMARISGLLSYLLIWGSMVWGLMLSTKVVKSWISPALTVSVHEYLSWLGLGFGLFHGLILLGDSYISFQLSDILIPFTASFEPVWVGLGTISLYLYGLILGSFYVRKQIGPKVWRSLHYLTFLVYLVVTAHTLMLGSDSNLWLTQLIYLWSGAVVLFLIFYRILSKG